MAFGLDDALLGWLVASAGSALLSRLRGDPARKAMRQLVDRAIAETVTEVGSHLGGQQAQHLRTVLRENDAKLDRTAVSSIDELGAALCKWVAGLDHPESGKPGYVDALGVDAQQLGETLTARIAAGIREHGRAGGPLAPLADWLWRDEVASGILAIRRDLLRLDRTTQPPDSCRGGLPGGARDFTGRQRVLDELAARIQAHDPAGNVVEIHAVDGMAGVGKTELALRVAHQHKHRYPAGRYFINLHGYTEAIAPLSPDAALEELLRQAGVPSTEIPLDFAGRQARWYALMAPERSLILLDNALDSDQVRPLLPNAAGCLVLITSRSRLRDLPGVQAWHLDVLPPGEAVELFTRVANTDRRIDRATVARAVDIVGRLPVAVRAVASQVDDHYTEAELADELTAARSCADLVDAGGPLGPAVCAAFETSLQRLDQLLQRAFLALGLHPGPSIGVPQFAAIAGMPTRQAHKILRTLTARNLITPSHTSIGHRRYQLHDLLREFAALNAQRRTAARERSEAAARLTHWYATAIDAIELLLADAQPASVEMGGLSLADSTEAGEWLAVEQAHLLALAQRAPDGQATHVCNRAARCLFLLGYYAAARTLHQSAIEILQHASNRGEEAYALNGLGNIALSTGDYPIAAKHFSGALAICRQINDRAGQANSLNGLGKVALLTGDLPTATDHSRQALTISERIGGTVAKANALRCLGRVSLALGDYESAGEYLRAALVDFQQSCNQLGEANTLAHLGHLARLTDDCQRATELLRAALAIFRHIGNRLGESYTLTGLGQVAGLTGNYRTAREHFHAALAISHRTGDRHGEADALTGLAHVESVNWRRDKAHVYWERAIEIYADIGSPLAETERTMMEGHGRN